MIVREDELSKNNKKANNIIKLNVKKYNSSYNTKKEKPDYYGHRERLTRRYYMAGDLKGFADHEILEMILFYTINIIDTKPIARRLLDEFGSIEKVFSASYDRLVAVISKDIRPSKQEWNKSALFIKFIRSIAVLLWNRGAKNKFNNEIDTINNGAELLKYLRHYFIHNLEAEMRDLEKEEFIVIFLNTNNKIIKTEKMFEGTVSQTGVYPREILKRALELNASKIIAVHNHPAGTLNPSNADIAVTRTLQTACDSLGISLLDHIIIGDRFNSPDQQKGFYSFAENGLL